MRIRFEVTLDCTNPNGKQIPTEIIQDMLQDVITESHVLVSVEKNMSWDLFIDSFKIEIQSIIDEHG